MLSEELNKEIEFLEKREEELKRKKFGTKSKLNICPDKKRVCYYRKDETTGIKTYITDADEIKWLAQAEYYKRLKPLVVKELKAAKKLKAIIDGSSAESLFYKLSKERQKLVSPVIPTDEEFIKQWMEEPWTSTKAIEKDKSLRTDNGSYVRSRIELIIGNKITEHKNPYKYEYPLDMGKDGIWYPDFTILNTKTREEIIWEHYGMVDSPDYVKVMLKKRRLYIKHGFIPGKNMIETFETRENPLNTEQIERLIEFYFKK